MTGSTMWAAVVPAFLNDFNRLKTDYGYLEKNLRPFGPLQNGGPKGGAWGHVH